MNNNLKSTKRNSSIQFLTHIWSMMYTVLMASSFQMNVPSKDDQYNDRKEGYNHNYSYNYCWQHNIWQPSRSKRRNQLVTVTPTNYSWSYVISVWRVRRGIAASWSRVEWYFWSNYSLYCTVTVLPEKYSLLEISTLIGESNWIVMYKRIEL